jgi:hypothetical protein
MLRIRLPQLPNAFCTKAVWAKKQAGSCAAES